MVCGENIVNRQKINGIMAIARPAIVATYGRQPLKLVEYRDRLAYQGKPDRDILVCVRGRKSDYQVIIEHGVITGIKELPRPAADPELEKLERWNHTLNTWEWPDDMPGKPENWDSLHRAPNINIPPEALTRIDIIRPLRKLIQCWMDEI